MLFNQFIKHNKCLINSVGKINHNWKLKTDWKRYTCIYLKWTHCRRWQPGFVVGLGEVWLVGFCGFFKLFVILPEFCSLHFYQNTVMVMLFETRDSGWSNTFLPWQLEAARYPVVANYEIISLWGKILLNCMSWLIPWRSNVLYSSYNYRRELRKCWRKYLF